MERSQAASAELGPPPALRLHDALEQSRSNLGNPRTDVTRLPAESCSSSPLSCPSCPNSGPPVRDRRHDERSLAGSGEVRERLDVMNWISHG
jgi:hypothetical protein